MNEPELVRAKRTKIGVFFDGAYAEKIREREGWGPTFYGQLIPEMHHRAAEWLGVEPDRCAVATQQWFRGRFTVDQVRDEDWRADKRLQVHERECLLWEQLCLAGVDTYRRPMQIVDRKPKEKGIDQLLQARTLHAIETEDLDAIVLIAGDSDHITLFEEAFKLGAKTILVWYEDQDEFVKSSYKLIQKADCSFRLEYIEQRPRLRADRKRATEGSASRQAPPEARAPAPGMPSRV